MEVEVFVNVLVVYSIDVRSWNKEDEEVIWSKEQELGLGAEEQEAAEDADI